MGKTKETYIALMEAEVERQRYYHDYSLLMSLRESLEPEWPTYDEWVELNYKKDTDTDSD
jgi:hypothetical protein